MPRKLTPANKITIKKSTEKYNDNLKPVIETINEYKFRLRANDDVATIVLVGHLLVENLIDKIIQMKCKDPHKILKDIRFTFSIKLQIVYAMGLMPNYIQNNIARINKFRNKFAHSIEFNINPNEMLLSGSDRDFPYFSGNKKLTSEKEYSKNPL